MGCNPSSRMQSKVTGHDVSVLELKMQRDKFVIETESLEKKIIKDKEAALAYVRENKLKLAEAALRMKKHHMKLLDYCEVYLIKVDQLIHSAETAELQNDIFAALENGNKMIQSIQKDFSLDAMKSVLDKLEEYKDDQKQFNNLLESYGIGESDAELENEMAAIKKEMESGTRVVETLDTIEMKQSTGVAETTTESPLTTESAAERDNASAEDETEVPIAIAVEEATISKSFESTETPKKEVAPPDKHIQKAAPKKANSKLIKKPDISINKMDTHVPVKIAKMITPSTSSPVISRSSSLTPLPKMADSQECTTQAVPSEFSFSMKDEYVVEEAAPSFNAAPKQYIQHKQAPLDITLPEISTPIKQSMSFQDNIGSAPKLKLGPRVFEQAKVAKQAADEWKTKGSPWPGIVVPPPASAAQQKSTGVGKIEKLPKQTARKIVETPQPAVDSKTVEKPKVHRRMISQLRVSPPSADAFKLIEAVNIDENGAKNASTWSASMLYDSDDDADLVILEGAD